MRILFITHRVPYPLDHGAKIRAFHFIRHLSQTHSLTIATLAESEEEVRCAAPLRNYCDDLMVEVLPAHHRWLQAIKALFTLQSSSVAYFWSARLQKRINETLEKSKFDAVIVFCGFAAQYVLQSNIRLRILDYVDIDSAKWADYSVYKPWPLSAAYAYEAKKLRRYECNVARHFHHCTVISAGELGIYNTFDVGVGCSTVPNGVDGGYFQLEDGTQNRSAIVFLGRMDYFPNVDAVQYFANEIFPLIQNSRPDAELRIIGSNPTKCVRNLAQLPNIFVTGHVADVRPYLKDAAVSIAPLRIARGTQNKILEAMAMGIPVVATPEAAKGVDAIPSKHLLVANSPKQFADEVLRLLNDEQLRKQITQSAREQIEQRHAWPEAMNIFDSILSKLQVSAPVHEISAPTLLQL
jgi:polysaccharide biosynthesis protein PslH